MEESIESWLKDIFSVDCETILKALKLSPSAQGYIHGAISEILLIEYLKKLNYEVHRIKEKPSGGFNEKKTGYKGDFLVKKNGTNDFYVVECKGLKTNSEFRSAETDDEHEKRLTKQQAYNQLKKFINVDKESIYNKGYRKYLQVKEQWESKNTDKKFPEFNWNKNFPGPDNVDLTPYFKTLQNLKNFIENCDLTKLSENAFRKKVGLYKILQTHKPSGRIDEYTEIKQAAPLSSDFSILAVDLFQRIGKHEFVFVNPDIIAHSPTSPNHLYQNYIIDVLIPGIKDELTINHPWYTDIDVCIKESKPKIVKYDESQIDYREN